MNNPYKVSPKPPGTAVVVVLANGQGRRFRASLTPAQLDSTDCGYGNKLEAMLGERSVLDHTLAAARASGLPVFVMDGNACAQPCEGMGDSIAAAVGACAWADAWLILPGDVPMVRTQTIEQVAAAVLSSPNLGAVVAPSYQGVLGHPVGFGRAYGAALCAIGGELGAQAVVHSAKAAGQFVDLAVDDAGIAQDVDTWAHLQALRASMV
jgi:molybdenum cofactor cytidylyltransferase